MGLYRRGNVYWCRWRIGGEEVRETTGSSDREEAQEYHDRRRAELWRARKLGERRVTWDEAALAWLEEHAHLKRSYADDLLKVRWLTKHLSGADVAEFGRDALCAIRDTKIEEGCAASTANRHLATVSAVLHFAAGKWGTKTPMKMPYLPEDEERITWLTREDAERLLAALPEHLAQMAKFSLATGLRRANVTGLEWSSVDLGRRIAWIWPDEAKAGKAIAVPLNEDAAAVLQERLGGHPRFVFTFRGRPVIRTKTKAWDAAVARSGCPSGLRWHDLRHTWATWHVMAGTPLEVLMKLGGWSSYAMVLRYSHFAPGYLADYASKVQRAHITGHSQESEEAGESAATEEKTGVADGIRTHDNRNHKPLPDNVRVLHQDVTRELRAKRRHGKA